MTFSAYFRAIGEACGCSGMRSKAEELASFTKTEDDVLTAAEVIELNFPDDPNSKYSNVGPGPLAGFY